MHEVTFNQFMHQRSILRLRSHSPVLCQLKVLPESLNIKTKGLLVAAIKVGGDLFVDCLQAYRGVQLVSFDLHVCKRTAQMPTIESEENLFLG